MTPRKILVALLLLAFLLPLYPAQAVGLTFGGRVKSSQYRTCNLYIGITTIPFPLQVMTVVRAGTSIKIVYPYYAVIFQMFGVYSSIYSWYQIYRAGPNVLGQYIPAPIPWTDCADLYPTNLITKIGTSLY